MSKWLSDGEVLVGQGSGDASSWSPRSRGPSAGGLVSSPVRARLSSPRAREAMPHQEPQTMDKARELFVLCDKEGKGFITKRDMQRLEVELPLSLDQLEDVFDSLDRESNGFLTPVEFNAGLGGIVVLDESLNQSQNEGRAEPDPVDWNNDPGVIRFVNLLVELGADTLFKNQWEVSSLWFELQRERPELLTVLDDILVHALAAVQDSTKEKDSLEQALRRRESEHDRIVQSIYEEMESQLKEEREKQKTQDGIKQWERGQHLEAELSMREQELESSLVKQREMESSVRALSCEQADIKEQKQRVQSLNVQLREQLESTREELQAAKSQLNLVHATAAQELAVKERNVLKVSRNIQKEKESLLRQLDILRDMNKRLRDETDTQQAQKRSPILKVLRKQGSLLGNYVLQENAMKRQLSSTSPPEQEREELSKLPKRRHSSSAPGYQHEAHTQTQRPVVSPQRVFKVVFLGNSGVGKTSFLRHYCTGHFSDTLSSTVGIDYQMKNITLGSINVVLQLWDTAGQERYKAYLPTMCFRYRSITQQYYRKADGILSMYDITDGDSFLAVREWLDCVQERKCEGAVLMLLGNKEDMANDTSRKVTTQEGHRLAEHHQAEFYECSARSGYNIERLMSELARMLVAQQDRQCNDTLTLTENTAKRSCC
ncbi:EF-hand calcium-binding domain-containing protein 4A isoform X2 [Gadus macrocephalus]|nr:EF-hand calcium-binding domain-containing protein 4A isoform X2 [Gadus macrocephalus]XP_059917908.1 EF-hand calcium-binding domain-containing protein 4A isoform X2 [Gadus macrocephalus]